MLAEQEESASFGERRSIHEQGESASFGQRRLTREQERVPEFKVSVIQRS